MTELNPDDGVPRIVIVVTLPQPVETVTAILAALAKHFPDVTIDTSDPRGWSIELPPMRPP